MLDTTDKAYTLYRCDEVIDRVACRLTQDNWYGYKHFHDHTACVEMLGKRIDIYFHPFTGYQVLVIDNDSVGFYKSQNWKGCTGNVREDAEYLYGLVASML